MSQRFPACSGDFHHLSGSRSRALDHSVIGAFNRLCIMNDFAHFLSLFPRKCWKGFELKLEHSLIHLYVIQLHNFLSKPHTQFWHFFRESIKQLLDQLPFFFLLVKYKLNSTTWWVTATTICLTALQQLGMCFWVWIPSTVTNLKDYNRLLAKAYCMSETGNLPSHSYLKRYWRKTAP